MLRFFLRYAFERHFLSFLLFCRDDDKGYVILRNMKTYPSSFFQTRSVHIDMFFKQAVHR